MSKARILAGDVGGTKTLLAICDGAGRIEREESYPSEEYGGLEAIVAEFEAESESLRAAAFGVAGPVTNGHARITNLPWVIEEEALSRALGGVPVSLVNDMEATGQGVLHLESSSLETLHDGEERAGTRALVAVGTGLGEAILAWDGNKHWPLATEGGHVSFAPRDGEEIDLLRFLLGRYDHVSAERVLSGNGLAHLFEFVVEVQKVEPAAAVRERLGGGDDNKLIGEAGLAGRCPAAAAAVHWFSRLLAEHCTDLAVSTLALGGIYLGGGVVPKLLPVLRSDFAPAFAKAGRMSDLVRRIPVWVVLEEKSALRGAIRIALDLAGRS